MGTAAAIMQEKKGDMLMWTRRELKDRAKFALRNNYWRIVLVALILMVISGTGGSGTGSTQVRKTYREMTQEKEYGFNTNENSVGYKVASNVLLDNGVDFEDDYEDLGGRIQNSFSDNSGSAAFAVIVFAVLIISLIVLAVIFLLNAFLFNPLKVGAKRFFSRSLVEKAQIKEVVYRFDHNYLKSVKTMFLRDLFTFLWTLLFVIPGFIKHYEYYMIPYLLGENPDMDSKTAFAKSRQLMHGQKWNAFVLDLSFIGWHLLSAITLGILGIFYVNPYHYLTKAALFRRLTGVDQLNNNAGYQTSGAQPNNWQ